MPPVAAIVFLLLYNTAFWRRLIAATGEPGASATLLCVVLLIVAGVFTGFLALLNVRLFIKPFLALLCIGSAFASYFMDNYGIQIDRAMIRNLAETDVAEATELLHWKLWAWIVAAGVLPALLVMRLPLHQLPWPRHLAWSIGLALGAFALAAVLLLMFFKTLAPLVRENRDLRFLLAPTNYLHATKGYLQQRFARPAVLRPLGRDARKGADWQGQERPAVLVIVVGETARAQNFSLNGHQRETNPRLARQPGLVNFRSVTSCGTATAVSLPCMFSNLGRQDYADAQARSQESLLDVLSHAGIDVLWRNNNSGCKGVCDRVDYEDLSRPEPGASYCNDDECFDERLLERLPERLRSGKDMVVVLHQKGSHGPAYWKRTPAAFRKFGPVCATSELAQCSGAAIAAAYDNTILYTDHVVSRAIDMLRDSSARDGVDTALIYVSDHGESLGEDGLYLHGAPYLLAPPEQRRVPMMMWFSDGFSERFRFSRSCVAARADQPLSHDNLFHSVLGMLDVKTMAYNPRLDLFHACTTTAGAPTGRVQASGLR
ncbi:phosphoethanolamine transferase [Massilia sp. YMA4]|nr:phosphoethanolamine transferase [Massilia sp. YMA4]